MTPDKKKAAAGHPLNVTLHGKGFGLSPADQVNALEAWSVIEQMAHQLGVYQPSSSCAQNNE